MPSSFCCVYRKYLSDYQTINELVWCSMKRLNFRLGTKSCNGQTFAKPEFIPISGIRSLAQTTSKRENLTAFHLPASQSLTPRRSPPHNGNAAMNKKQRVLHIVGKNLTRIARPKPKVTRDMKNVSAVLHRCVNRIPSEEIALHPVDQTIAAHFFRSRQRPNISARLNQQRRHMTPDKTGCASDEDMLSDEKMMKIVRDHADRMIAGTSCFRAWMTSAGKSISIHGSPVTSSYPNRPASTNVLKTSS